MNMNCAHEIARIKCLWSATLSPCWRRHSCQKVWLGINFYGKDFVDKVREGDVVLGHDYTRILEQQQTDRHWDEVIREHVTTYQKDGTLHRMYYPTPEMIQVCHSAQADPLKAVAPVPNCLHAKSLKY